MNFEFEKEIVELDNKIVEMKKFSEEKGIDLSGEISKFVAERDEKLKEIYKNLSSWDKVFVSRHPERPYTLDYIENIATDFIELHGDRLFKDDPAIVGGFCNFGMANPEGYRKALRLFKMAERFSIPIVTFIDTPGAYPGLEAEEHGQGEAIARNLMEMSGLKVPVISFVIGEGGSGGALGLGVSDRIYMLENSVYSVISPEGCAAILYKDASRAEEAAENLKITAQSLYKLGVIDGIVEEPAGGAHRDHKCIALNLKNIILSSFSELEKISVEELVENRYNKFRKMGSFIGTDI